MPIAELTPLLLSTAVLALVAIALLWLLSIPLKDVSIIDMAFSGLIAGLIALAWWHSGAQGDIPHLLLGLVLLWALRMTAYLVKRNWGHGEDPRYSKLRHWVAPGWPFFWFSLRKVFVLQGVVIWVLTLPLQIAMVTGQNQGIGWLALAGTLVWVIGFVFEAVGDWQLARFKADPSKRGQVLNSGLWRYTRHPNYFGELAQWWGLFIICLAAPWAWLGVIGPLVYSWLVIRVTGQATLDKKLMREKPGYAEYVQQTNGLLPWFPRI